MDGKWGKLAAAAVFLGVIVGCRTAPPIVKPDTEPEVLNRPPQEARFNNPGMAKQCFNRDDPTKRWRDLTMDNAVMPARASFGGPSAGMMR
jgi:hypothetical protein